MFLCVNIVINRIKPLIFIITVLITACNINTNVDDSSGISVQLNLTRSDINIESLSLTVEADDMDTITSESEGSDSISIEVEEGSDRTFTIVVTLDTGETLTGTKTKDITSSTSSISIDVTYNTDTYYVLNVTNEDGDEAVLMLTIYDSQISFCVEESYDDVTYIYEYYRGDDYTISETDGIKTITLNDVADAEDQSDDDSYTEEFGFTFDQDQGTTTVEEILIGTYDGESVTGTYSFTGTFESYSESSETYLLSIDVDSDGEEEDITRTDSIIYIDYTGIDNTTDLTPTITVSLGATISPGSGESQDFSSDVVYTITAEDGTETTYTISSLE